MSRPSKDRAEPRNDHLTVRLSTGLKQSLQIIAQARGTTVNALVVAQLTKAVNHPNAMGKPVQSPVARPASITTPTRPAISSFDPDA